MVLLEISGGRWGSNRSRPTWRSSKPGRLDAPRRRPDTLVRLMPKTSDPTRFKLPSLRRDPAGADLPEQKVYLCANCARPLTGPDALLRGADVAWHGCCRDCDELAAAQMELAMERANGAAIQVYRCLQCGDLRSCRPGWRTRCHVCLDERTDARLLEENSQECLAMFGNNPLLALQAGRNLNLSRGEPITPKAIVQATACLTIATQLARYERPGWTVIATDVWGLPWRGVRSRPTSHGTWGQHDACGTMAVLQASSVDCPACGPQPGSRTHLARQDEQYLLYQVTYGSLTKFGVGTEARVREHILADATVVLVLRSSFAAVVSAERKLKIKHAGEIVNKRTRRMPPTFGQGTEVLSRGAILSLTDALPGAENVTHLFV